MSVERIEGEPVELVTDFGSLAPGQIVWLTGCAACGSRHRWMLLSPGRGCVRVSLFDVVPMDVWFVAPQSRCPGVDTLQRPSVAERRIYRVINPPREEPADTEAEKPRKAVRA